MPPIITLTTDFGAQDSFVGAMKGVILTYCPEAQLVDLCHEVAPGDLRGGALRLATAAPYFPAGTVHLAVVDPGVGSQRRALAVRSHGQVFVGPDNGVLSLAFDRAAPDWLAVALTRREYWRPQVSHTFHGRDVFAPVAAHIAAGVALEALGEAVSDPLQLPWPTPRRIGDHIVGEVIDVDRFGNLISNVGSAEIGNQTVERVEVGGRQIAGLSTWYDPSCALVAVVSSGGCIEVAVPGGNAARQLGVGVGGPVTVRVRGPAPA